MPLKESGEMYLETIYILYDSLSVSFALPPVALTVVLKNCLSGLWINRYPRCAVYMDANCFFEVNRQSKVY